MSLTASCSSLFPSFHAFPGFSSRLLVDSQFSLSPDLLSCVIILSLPFVVLDTATRRWSGFPGNERAPVVRMRQSLPSVLPVELLFSRTGIRVEGGCTDGKSIKKQLCNPFYVWWKKVGESAGLSGRKCFTEIVQENCFVISLLAWCSDTLRVLSSQVSWII